ncbi:hypothetical protein DH2020_040762 [Rehmannia glutinosa]|uniref:non-specific serine/threonine protein kinase n=1 Tax=Rehmannia glutinosa TaxID=99300 RepID=A0ABR0US85_REHGL
MDSTPSNSTSTPSPPPPDSSDDPPTRSPPPPAQSDSSPPPPTPPPPADPVSSPPPPDSSSHPSPAAPPPPAGSLPPNNSSSPPPPADDPRPPSTTPSTPSGSPAPVFSPPPPGGASGRSPPSADLSPSPPGSSSDSGSSGSSSSDSNTDVAIIAGIIGAGVVILALMTRRVRFSAQRVLPNGREVAVKSLKSGSGQGEREFQAEVEIISRVHHRYLVSLVGYCIAGEQRMLVYEYVPNKTLEFHLHGKGRPVMDWASRLRIAVGSAKGLAYLHEDCHPRIIHRDIKAANILLDSNFEAKVADFGLAKLSSDNYTHVSTRVMGTFGYLAPEYAASGKLTEKSDVFSFGVMLLELITGRRPVDPTNKTMDSLSLVDWARPLSARALETGDYSGLVDRRLEDNYVPHEMARMIACAAACIRHSAKRRPRMSQIVRALDGDSSLEDLNEGVKPGQSQTFNPNGNIETYDTGAYNADMMKFRKMVMLSQEFNSTDYGATSEYGLNPSSSSTDSTEIDLTSPQKQKR